MADHYNKATKRYSSRGHTPDLVADPNEIVKPMMADGTTMREAVRNGLNPRLTVALEDDTVRRMTQAEIDAAQAAAQKARQNAKPPATKARENAYRDVCVKYGFDEAVSAEAGLQDALEAELDGALLDINNPAISRAFAAVSDALVAQNLATKINVDDIPTDGHDMGV